jgi:hypothetical protein
MLSLNISYFQLKNSKIKIIQAKDAIQIYHNNHFIFIKVDVIYNRENSIKKEIEYIIASGNIGTSKGTGE